MESHESGRGRKCCPFEDTAAIIRNDFGYVIKAKEDSPDPLCHAPSCVPAEVAVSSNYFRFLLAWGITSRAVRVAVDGGSVFGDQMGQRLGDDGVGHFSIIKVQSKLLKWVLFRSSNGYFFA